MAATYALLKGGPCDGIQRKLAADGSESRQLICKQSIYLWDYKGPLANGDFLYHYAGPYLPPSSAGRAGHVHSGWNDLRHSVNHVMPASLAASRRNLHAALRTLARARKVRLK